MHKLRTLVLVVVVFLFSISPVMAICDNSEMAKLRGIAINIKPSYEPKEDVPEGEYTPPDGEEDQEYEKAKTLFHIVYIANLTEDVYVKITNNVDNTVQTFYYSDTDNGTVMFRWGRLELATKFTIDVYSTDKTGCPNTKLYTHTLITPYYNFHSESSICKKIPEFYLCNKFLSIPSVSYYEFEELANRYYKNVLKKQEEEEQKKEEEKKGFGAFIKDNAVVIAITSLVIVSAGVIVTVIIVKKQRRRIV
mgnify:CR=1 FL=1